VGNKTEKQQHVYHHTPKGAGVCYLGEGEGVSPGGILFGAFADTGQEKSMKLSKILRKDQSGKRYAMWTRWGRICCCGVSRYVESITGEDAEEAE